MEHYYTPDPHSSHAEKTFQLTMAGQNFTFVTDSSVFSRGRLDYGTRLLLEACLADCADWQGRVLDLGCGYGVLGIVLKSVCRQLQVTMLDVNRRAVELARHNLAINQLKGIELIQQDGLAGLATRFTVIVTNPPIRAGKKTVYKLLAQAQAALLPGGRLYLVIQKKQGAASARRELAKLFDQVEILSRSAGYQVIRCLKT